MTIDVSWVSNTCFLHGKKHLGYCNFALMLTGCELEDSFELLGGSSLMVFVFWLASFFERALTHFRVLFRGIWHTVGITDILIT